MTDTPTTHDAEYGLIVAFPDGSPSFVNGFEAGRIDQWLLKGEPDFYEEHAGSDPYAVWITRLNGLNVEKVPARLLAYADADYKTAHVIFMDGKRGTVFKEQMTVRKD